MNSWNFNELTQQDILDYKSCQRQDGSIYGVPDKSECQQGKELKADDLQKIAMKANKGDAKAKAQLAEVKKVEKEQKDKAREEKKKAKEAEKKKKEAEGGKKGKGKKGGGGKGKKGGAGKKGGGKGKAEAKGGKGRGGGTKSADTRQAQAQRRKEAINRARETVSKLQKMLRGVADPKAKQQIQTAISDLLKSVVDATKADMGQAPAQTPQAGALRGQVQAQQQQEGAKDKA